MHVPGEKIKDFRLLERLGSGAYGEVSHHRWETKGHKSERFVAVKFLKRTTNPLDQTVLQNEADIWYRATGHANVVPFHVADLYLGQAFIVSEYREKGSLDHWLDQHEGQAPSVVQAIAVACGILNGLDHLHRLRPAIIHRDLTAGNILLNLDDEPQIADFGIARRLLDSTGATSSVAGTEMYMAPEAFRGEVSPALDLWSAAVILYRMLSGRFPFPDRADIENEYVEMARLPTNVPEVVQEVVARALSKNRSERFTTARDFREALTATVPHFSDEQKQSALERYRQVVQTLCGNIDLAKLPEDRLVAAMPLPILELFVGLRIRAEYNSDEPDGEDSGNDEPQFTAPRDPKARRVVQPPEHIGARLQASRGLVILGGPGAGKSTLVNWLAAVYLNGFTRSLLKREEVKTLPRKEWLPIVVRCRYLDWKTVTDSLDDILQGMLEQMEMPRSDVPILRSVLREMLEEDKAILLVDGLDDITDLGQRVRLCERLQLIHNALPNATLLVTARITGYRELGRVLQGFDHRVVADLLLEDKRAFAQRWYASTKRAEGPSAQKQAARDLIAAIQSSDRIDKLTGNPMLLTTLALVKRRFDKLPRNRSELYEETVQVLLHWRNWRHAQKPDALEEQESLPQIKYLAYVMCERPTRRLRSDEVVRLLTDLRKEYPALRKVRLHNPEDFLKLFGEQTGILDHVAETSYNGRRFYVYRYLHSTFQEYLAAMALTEGYYPGYNRARPLSQHVAALMGRLFKPVGSSEPRVPEMWREVLRLCVACCGHEAEDVLRAILTPCVGESPAVERARSAFAAHCLAEEPNVSDTVVEEVLTRFVGHISEQDGQGMTPTAIDLAARELGGSEFNERIQHLLLKEFLSRPARLTAGASPSSRERPGVLYALNAYARVSDSDLGGWLKKRWEDLVGPDAGKAVGAALAVMEAGYFGKVNALHGIPEALVELLDRGGVSTHAAVWALVYLREDGAFWKADAKVLDRLAALVADPGTDHPVVAHCARLFARHHHEPAIPALIGRLAEPNLLQVVGSALVALGDAVVEPLLDKVENHPDEWDLKMPARAVLEHLDRDGTRFAWTDWLEDPEPKIRRQALGVVARKARLEEVDKKLLSQKLTGQLPWRDPKQPLEIDDLPEIADGLKLSSEEIKRRFEALAERCRLNLTWI